MNYLIHRSSFQFESRISSMQPSEISSPAGPVFVPAYGERLAPEPEESSLREKVADSLALSGVMAALGVPPGIAEIVELAHHGMDIAEEGTAPGMAAPPRPNISISPAAFRPQDALRPRRSM
jgi:hypothetical protein